MLLLFWRVPRAASATVRAAGASGSVLAVSKGGTVPITLRAPARIAASGSRATRSFPVIVGTSRAQLVSRRDTRGVLLLGGAARGTPISRKATEAASQLRGSPRTVSGAGLRVSAGVALVRVRPRTAILATAVTGATYASVQAGALGRVVLTGRKASVAAVLAAASPATTISPLRASLADLGLITGAGAGVTAESARAALAVLAATPGSDVASSDGRRSRGRVDMAAAAWSETALLVGHSGLAVVRAQSAGTLVLYTSILSPSVPFDPHRPLDLGTVYRGDTIILPVWQARDRAGNIIDLSGSTVWFTAKVDLASSDATTPTIQCSTADGGVVILDAPSGLYRVTLVSSQTYPLTDDTTFTFDVQVITPAPITRTIKWGSLRVVRDVTRAVA